MTLSYHCLCYFIDSVGTDGEAMKNLKSSEAYQYLHSNKVGRVLLKEVGHDRMYLKADIEPSQSLKVPHHKAWVLVSAADEIQKGEILLLSLLLL